MWYLDEVNARRAAYLVAGLLIWILHAFVRLALWPLLNLSGDYYRWGGIVVMIVLTAVCAYYLLSLTPGHRVLSALYLALVWLVVYAVAEYARNLYTTHAWRYPLDELASLALSVLYIPLTALACGVFLQASRRKHPDF